MQDHSSCQEVIVALPNDMGVVEDVLARKEPSSVRSKTASERSEQYINRLQIGAVYVGVPRPEDCGPSREKHNMVPILLRTYQYTAKLEHHPSLCICQFHTLH